MSDHGLALPFPIAKTTSRTAVKTRVRTSTEWRDYFEANAKKRIAVPWESGAGVTAEELASIARSLQAWQLGETSDGSHLIAAATHYALMMRDPAFVDAIRLFIKEEQRHGNDLGRFLDLAGVPRLQRDWGDSMFRRIRYLFPSMEVWVTPVIMVETHAMIYYAALRRATNSPVLRKVCEQILRDEVPHIEFQCERLAILHRGRSPLMMAVTRALHRFFFTGITLAVWAAHHRAYRAGGLSFAKYWRAS